MAPRILIVDDESAIRYAIDVYLTVFGYCVEGAEDVESAEFLLATRAYHAVIADLRLGGSEEFGGLRVIDAARQQVPRPCIVLLSADHSPLLVQKALQRGADFALQKPLPLFDLKRQLAECLSGHRRCAPKPTTRSRRGGPLPGATPAPGNESTPR